MKPKIALAAGAVALAAGLAIAFFFQEHAVAAGNVPKFEPDPSWPKPLPHNWMLGGIGGIVVDSHDHIWVANRPRSLQKNDTYAAADPPEADCCVPAPPVLEFDMAGNLVQGLGRSRRGL